MGRTNTYFGFNKATELPPPPFYNSDSPYKDAPVLDSKRISKKTVSWEINTKKGYTDGTKGIK